jgi:hypothetical protein
MAIKIKSNQIEIGQYYLTDSSTGLFFSGKVNAASTLPFVQGSTKGYASGGMTFPTPLVNTIDSFPFATNSNATDVGDLTVTRQGGAGQSSTVSGYTSGGLNTPSTTVNIIDKFPFAANANATDVGDLTVTGSYLAGQSSDSNGYAAGLIGINKFPFASNANASSVGVLTTSSITRAGQSAGSFGYASSIGTPSSPGAAALGINKFPFSTDANATNIGNLTQGRILGTGQSSAVSGYTSGGSNNPPAALLNIATLDKFPFATDASASSVGTLTQGRSGQSGQSSLSRGYSSGGVTYPTPQVNTIDSFPFASDASATDVGDLTVVRQGVVGQQV